MKFKFQLQVLLDHVLLQEDKKKQQLALVVQKIESLKEEQKKTNENIQHLLSQSRETDMGWERVEYDMAKVEYDVKHLEVIKQKLIDQEELRVQTREELNAISLKREAIESLKDKQSKEFKRELNKREQKQLEEIHRYFHMSQG